jgi:hypothetical protein
MGLTHLCTHQPYAFGPYSDSRSSCLCAPLPVCPLQAYQPSTLNDVAPVSMPPNPSGGGGLEVDVNSSPYEEMTEAGLRRVSCALGT